MTYTVHQNQYWRGEWVQYKGLTRAEAIAVCAGHWIIGWSKRNIYYTEDK